MRISAVLASLILCACGGGPQSEPNQPQPPQQKLSGPTVFIGDSITYGWVELADLVPGSINVGIPGQRSWEMAARFDTDVLDKHPDTVVILAGTNDVFSDPAISAQYIYAMAARAQSAGARVIVGTIPPGDNYHSSSFLKSEQELMDAIAKLNSEIRDGAKNYGYTVVDYYPHFLRADGSLNPDLYFADRIHPNDAGYDAMWGMLRPIL